MKSDCYKPSIHEVLYNNLLCDLMKFNVLVIDRMAYGWMTNVKKHDFIIYVDRSFSWKRKLFTLAHETGHYFSLRGRTLFPTKMANEKTANKRCIKILRTLNVKNAEKEYYKFYDWIRNKLILYHIRNKDTKWRVTKIDPK